MFYALFGLFALLNGLDAYLTWSNLHHPTVSEANPFLRYLMGKLGVLVTLLGTKVLALVGIVWMLHLQPSVAIPALVCGDVLFAWVVWHNFQIWKRYRSA